LVFAGVVAEPDEELEGAAGGVATTLDPLDVLGGVVTTLDPLEVSGVVATATLDEVGVVDADETELESVALLPPPPPQPTMAATQATRDREASSGRVVQNIVRRP